MASRASSLFPSKFWSVFDQTNIKFVGLGLVGHELQESKVGL